jgi:hypothetical protein
VASFWSKLAYFATNWRSLLRPPSFGSFFVSLPACALVVGLLGVARLGHQFPGAAASPGLLVPFLLPVLGLALEAGGLVALSVSQLSTLLREPATTAVGRARASWLVLGLLSVVLLVAEAIPRGTEHPGAFANDLLETARDSCSPGLSVPVPLLGLSVKCDAPQRIEGPMPGVPKVQVAMEELIFSDDLRSVEIDALELSAARSLRVHLKTQTARVAGLAPWSRSPRLSPFVRFAILLALGFALWLTSLLALRHPLPLPPVGNGSSPALVGRLLRAAGWLSLALPGVLSAAVFVSLDQDRAAPVTYLSAALVGALAAWLVGAVLARRLPQIFN